MVANMAFQAAHSGDLNILESLSDSQLNDSVVDEYGATCLHISARNDNVDVVNYLINKRSFNPCKRTNVGATSAHDAAATGSLNVLQWLLTNTPQKVDDQDGSGATGLHLAARYGHTHILQWYLQYTNCDVMKKTASGALPLHFAVLGGDLEAVQALIEEAPRSANIQTSSGVTSVYVACQEGRLDIVKFLVLQAGGSIKMQSYDGMSCIHAAAQTGRLSCVQWLVEEQKCKPNERDFDGATPLHFAASKGHSHIIAWLLQHGGARISLDNLGGSPLHNAAEMGEAKCVESLLANGCDPKITDNSGLTALELAEVCHQEVCVTILQGKPVPNGDFVDGSKPVYTEIKSVNGFTDKTPPLNGHASTSSTPVTDDSTVQKRPPNAIPQSFAKTQIVEAEVHFSSPESELDRSAETGELEKALINSRQLNSSSGHYRAPPNFKPPPPPGPPFPRSRKEAHSDISSTTSSLSSASQFGEHHYEDDLNHSSPTDKLYMITTPPGDKKQETVTETNSYTASKRQVSVVNISSSDYDITMAHNGTSNILSNFAKDVQIEEKSVQNSSEQKPNISRINVHSDRAKIAQSNGQSLVAGHKTNVYAKVENSRPGLAQHGSHAMMNGDATPNGDIDDFPPPPPPLPSSILCPPPPPPPPTTQAKMAPRPTQLSSRPMSPSSHSRLSSATPSPLARHDIISEMLSKGTSGLRKTQPTGPTTMSFTLGNDGVIVQKNITRANGNENGGLDQIGELDEVDASNLSSKSEQTDGPEVIIINKVDLPYEKKAVKVIAIKKEYKRIGEKSSEKEVIIVSKHHLRNHIQNFNNAGTVLQHADKDMRYESVVLDGDFSPSNFLDKTPADLPDWKRQMMAKKMAEEGKREADEKKKIDDHEAKFKNVPAWKRALMEKKEVEQRTADEQSQAQAKTQTNVKYNAVRSGPGTVPWLQELKSRKS